MPNPSAVVCEPTDPKSGTTVQNSCEVTLDCHNTDSTMGNPKKYMGVLDVCIHQARDIHNICIYHKQDVYAKLSLTNDPETAISTKTINGGGQNPVFNEKFRLNIHTIDSTIKCEIWMLSRVRNYLQDQLLGFTLVPISDVLIENGKPEKEYPLTSSDLFHSPAGFVQLTMTYTGEMPEMMEIPILCSSSFPNVSGHVSGSPNSEPFEKIEFPDPEIVEENEMMVSEYFGIPCSEIKSKDSEEIDVTDKDNHIDSDIGVRLVECFGKNDADIKIASKIETPPTSVSTNESFSGQISTAAQSVSYTAEGSKSPNQDVVSSLKEKSEDVLKLENGSSDKPVVTFPQPVISVNVEPEPKVVQQEIVDMYMKSMQQFTEALAKMKLPLDIVDNGSTIKSESADSESSTSDEKAQSSKSNGPSPRVFYGSRAFF